MHGAFVAVMARFALGRRRIVIALRSDCFGALWLYDANCRACSGLFSDRFCADCRTIAARSIMAVALRCPARRIFFSRFCANKHCEFAQKRVKTFCPQDGACDIGRIGGFGVCFGTRSKRRLRSVGDIFSGVFVWLFAMQNRRLAGCRVCACRMQSHDVCFERILCMIKCANVGGRLNIIRFSPIFVIRAGDAPVPA